MSSFAFVTYKGKFLLVLRDDIPIIASPNTWSLLGGKNEPGETPEETAIRELKEEANIDVQELKPLFVEYYEDRIRHVYSMELTDEQARDIKLGDEGQKLDYFTLEQMEKLPVTPTLKQELINQQEELKKLLTRREAPLT